MDPSFQSRWVSADGRWQRRVDLKAVESVKALIDLSGLPGDHPLVVDVLTLLRLGRVEPLKRLIPLLEAHAAKKVMKATPFPLLTEEIGEGLILGVSTDLVEDGVMFRQPLSDWERHGGVFGPSGSGKTWLLMSTVGQIAERNSRPVVWVLDRTRDYLRLLPLFSREVLWYLKPEWIRINLLEPRGAPKEWLSRLLHILRSVYFGREGVESLLSTTIQGMWEERGCFRGTENWPTLTDLWNRLGILRFAASSRSSQYLESSQRIVRTLMDRLGEMLDTRYSTPIDELLSHSIIWDVSQLGVPEFELFASILLELVARSSP